jgi:hypothetical protein
MDKWREANGYGRGAFAIGYHAGERARIKKACDRGDQPGFTAWYPLIAWGIDQAQCRAIVASEGLPLGKSSCYFCPNMTKPEWQALRREHPVLFRKAVEIEQRAKANGVMGRGGKGLHWVGGLENIDNAPDPKPRRSRNDEVIEDRCHHGGCFT